MEIRRRFAPLREWKLPGSWKWPRPWRFPPLAGRRHGMWVVALLGALGAGYLTAALLLFPAPILPSRREIPRVLGMPAAEAKSHLTDAGLRIARDSSETHPRAQTGSVIWQDPPPGTRAIEGTQVTLVTSAGPAKIPVPDVAGYDLGLARAFVRAAGLTVSRVEAVPAPAPRGITVLSRPPAGSVLAAGSGVVLVVSEGAPTIAVPELLGLTTEDARILLEQDGLQMGTVQRRRTHDATPGTVVAQRPSAGTLAAPGTVVDIVLARSP